MKIVEKYLNSEDVILRMSADMLYTFANLTLGDAMAAQMAREDVHICLKKAFEDEIDLETQASCLFALYVISVLIHIPPEKEMPLLSDYLRYLPEGQRLSGRSASDQLPAPAADFAFGFADQRVGRPELLDD